MAHSITAQKFLAELEKKDWWEASEIATINTKTVDECEELFKILAGHSPIDRSIRQALESEIQGKKERLLSYK
ncbi:MAG: hypothetical protein WCK60_01015 [Candidatus Nomurabacteria bacterium]